MADPTTIIAITSISAVSIGIITKLIIVCRKNIKNCWGITFRSPTSSVHEIEIPANNHQTNPHHEIHITPQVLNDITANGRNLV